MCIGTVSGDDGRDTGCFDFFVVRFEFSPGRGHAQSQLSEHLFVVEDTAAQCCPSGYAEDLPVLRHGGEERFDDVGYERLC